MIVQNLPRFGGKTTTIVKYMTAPGNEDVVCVAATEQQADIAWREARKYDPTINRSRFKGPRAMMHTPRSPQVTRVVVDEADGVFEALLNARIEMIALTGENQK